VPKLGEETLSKYMKFKEFILNVTHGENCPADPGNPEGHGEYIEVNEKLAQDIVDAYNYKPFSILHVHDFQTLPLARILKEKHMLDIPIVFTWHIPLTAGISPWWRSFFVGHMSVYDRLVFSTEEYVEAAVSMGLPKEKVVKISPFIDVEGYRIEGENGIRERYGIGKDEFLILCVSRIDPRKGQELLIEAVDKMAQENGMRRFRCVFVGNGSFSKELLKTARSERLQKLMDSVRERGLDNRVMFTGKVNDEDLHRLYDASDVVVQPSFQEGFGLTMSEAMVFGKPVIGSRVGGLPDQIEDGKNGYLFEKGNADQLKDRLVELMESPELRGEMGSNGSEMVRKRFSSEVGYERYLELYMDVLGKKL